MVSNLILEDIVKAALLEDLGRGHDITSQSVIAANATCRAILRTREDCVLAGLMPALTAFSLTDPDFSFEVHAHDGDVVEAGGDIAVIEGPAAAALTAERTAVNFLMHLSGIATLTRHFVLEVQGTKAKICDTRKTLPGLRALQKYAVRAGGGHNHRFGLDDAILIKDNHIALAGGVEKALKRARENAGHMVKIQIEVDILKQLEKVLKVQEKHGGVDAVLLDNFKLADLKKAVKMVGGAMVTEASGGVSLDTVADIAKTGVDYISVGALTHSAVAVDIALDVE